LAGVAVILAACEVGSGFLVGADAVLASAGPGALVGADIVLVAVGWGVPVSASQAVTKDTIKIRARARFKKRLAAVFTDFSFS
jgi:hypothetical protein